MLGLMMIKYYFLKTYRRKWTECRGQEGATFGTPKTELRSPERLYCGPHRPHEPG